MNDEHSLKELTFEITKECPMNCLLCSSNGGHAYDKELDFITIKRIIDESIQLGVTHINLSGGEPLIHPFIIDICSHIKEKGLTVDIYTCGNIRSKDGRISPIDKKILSSLKKISIDKLVFSIHGHTPELHDMMTTKEGGFNNLLESIKRTVKLEFFTELHFVPTKINYKSLPEIMDLLKLLNVDKLSVLRFVPQGRGKENISSLELNSEEITELRDILHKLKKEHSSLRFRAGAPFNCFQLGTPTFCTAGIDKATIKADASVFPCVSMKDFVIDKDNNILTRSLADIWRDSVLFNLTRISLRIIKEQSECKYCNHFKECRGGCLSQRIISNRLEQRDPCCIMPLDRIEKQIINKV